MSLTYQAYKGHFQNGRFVSPEAASIPDNSVVYVMVVDDDPRSFSVKAQEQIPKTADKLSAIKEIFADALAAESELTDSDWEEMANLRSQTNAGFARKIEL